MIKSQYQNGNKLVLDIPSRQSSGRIALRGSDGTTIWGQQQNSPAISTQNSNRQSLQNTQGYSVADGTQYQEASLTNLYDTGTAILAQENGKSYGYISDGQGGSVQPNATYRGRIQIQNKIVNGVVNNCEIENITPDSQSLGTFGESANNCLDFRVGTTVAGSFKVIRYPYSKLKPNTQYLLSKVTNVLVGSGDSNLGRINITNSSNASILQLTRNQDKGVFTVPADGIIKIQHLVTGSTSELSDIVHENMAFYEGLGISDTLPPSLAVDVNNSITQSQFYDLITQSDTNRIRTEVDGTPKIQRIGDLVNIDHDQQYWNVTTEQFGFFRSPLSGACYFMAGKFFDLIERLFDVNDNPLFDSEGQPLYGLKPGVTRRQ